MTTKPTPTLEDLLRAICKAETECPCEKQPSYHEQAIRPMFECNGTGRVPRFPELRAEWTAGWSHKNLCTESKCEMLAYGVDWHGLGYVPLWSKPEDAFLWIQVLSLAVGRPFHQAIIGDDWCSALRVATEALGIEVGQEETP